MHCGPRDGPETSGSRLRSTGSHYCPSACRTGAEEEASRQHKGAATNCTPGTKVGRDVEGLRGEVPTSLSLPSSYLLLTPFTDHNQSEIRGQGRSFQQDADNGLPDQRLAKRDGDGRGYTKSETLTKVRGVISNIILHMVADQDMLNLQEC